jgi:hypothetical protein
VFYYCRWSDNLARTAGKTVNTGTEDAGYPASNLSDDLPQRPAKLTTTAGSWLFDCGTEVAPELFCVIHHNLQSGSTAWLQASASTSFTSPALNIAVPIIAANADKFPVNLKVDLKLLYPFTLDRTYRYWRFVVAGNSVPVAVGEIVLSAKRRDLTVRNIKRGSDRLLRRPAVIHDTELLVRHAYDLGTTIRGCSVEIQPSDATLKEVETWFRDATATRPFIIIPYYPDPTGGYSSALDDDPWLVTFLNQDQPYKREFRNYNTLTIPFQELSRGLYPTPWP